MRQDRARIQANQLPAHFLLLYRDANPGAWTGPSPHTASLNPELSHLETRPRSCVKRDATRPGVLPGPGEGARTRGTDVQSLCLPRVCWEQGSCTKRLGGEFLTQPVIPAQAQVRSGE